MRNIIKLAAVAMFAFAGITTAASAQEIGYGANVTINVFNGCCNATKKTIRQEVTPARKASMPSTAFMPRAERPVRNRNIASTPVSVSGGSLNCQNDRPVASFTVTWVTEGSGDCPASISASDLAKLATLAAGGTTKMWASIKIPEKCPATGYAKLPVEASGNKIKLFPWRKSCGPYAAPRAR